MALLSRSGETLEEQGEVMRAMTTTSVAILPIRRRAWEMLADLDRNTPPTVEMRFIRGWASLTPWRAPPLWPSHLLRQHLWLFQLPLKNRRQR